MAFWGEKRSSPPPHLRQTRIGTCTSDFRHTNIWQHFHAPTLDSCQCGGYGPVTMTATQTTAIYHVGTPEEPAQKNPPITANSAEAAARKYVDRGDWGDATSVTVTVYEDDDGLPDHTRYSDVTVSLADARAGGAA